MERRDAERLAQGAAAAARMGRLSSGPTMKPTACCRLQPWARRPVSPTSRVLRAVPAASVLSVSRSLRSRTLSSEASTG
ncbi:hypothetical protein ETD86_16255 [Nonomuraea turkmeniaca]|uniref:Uncharacterized protein n=1 Tax=Nonomuraea turkmeniaca TaxID=103838 RepID=A0A5S4FK73_9ACTN|nr:hypothetical protein [Nonomuraea turkmeniaca]TMR21137.1 hypothetical protein ETD86_16255 [Nonomuraea turkmeniaca]